MNTKQIDFVPNELIISCPNCLVCSFAVADSELEAVCNGQQMVEVCQACGNIIHIHDIIARRLCK